MRHTAFALWLVVSLPSAALEVIRYAGGEPSAPLALTEPTFSSAEPLKQYLPIRSPSLTRGPAEARKLTTRFLQPLFLVGSDLDSLRWLEANRARLARMHAIGLLVQAETPAEVQAVTAAAHGFQLLPASGEVFAAELGIRHYPVLITREGIGP